MSDSLVLCYHSVSDRWDHPMAVRTEQLYDQVRALQERGYVFLTFTEARSAPHRGRTAVLTFDDAFRTVHDHAFPLLQDLGVSATVFVPTAFPDSGSLLAWPGFDAAEHYPARDLRPMSWDQVRTLADAGWEVGSHTRTHPLLTTVSDRRLVEELAGSRDDLEQQLGVPCTSLAYPFGDVDRRVARAAEDAGYTASATLLRCETAGEQWVPRVCVDHSDGPLRFAAKVAPVLRTPAASAVVDVVHRLRRSAAVPQPIGAGSAR